MIVSFGKCTHFPEEWHRLDYYKGKEFMSRVIVILFVSVASGQSVEILFVFKSPFWTKKYKNVEFYRLKSLHFRYISKISKFRTKISDFVWNLSFLCYLHQNNLDFTGADQALSQERAFGMLYTR